MYIFCIILDNSPISRVARPLKLLVQLKMLGAVSTMQDRAQSQMIMKHK